MTNTFTSLEIASPLVPGTFLFLPISLVPPYHLGWFFSCSQLLMLASPRLASGYFSFHLYSLFLGDIISSTASILLHASHSQIYTSNPTSFPHASNSLLDLSTRHLIDRLNSKDEFWLPHFQICPSSRLPHLSSTHPAPQTQNLDSFFCSFLSRLTFHSSENLASYSFKIFRIC